MKEIAAVIAGVVAVIFGALVLWKSGVAIWNTTFTLAATAVSIISWIVNVGVVIGTLGLLVIVVLAICLALAALLKQIEQRLIELAAINGEVLNKVKELVKGKPEKIVPVAIAGVVQCLILVLKDSALSTTMKVLLSVSVWTFATLLNLTVSQQKWRSFGLWGIILMLLVPLGIATAMAAYVGFNDPERMQREATAIRSWFDGQSLEDKIAGAIIAFFIILMPVGAVILARGKRSPDAMTAA